MPTLLVVENDRNQRLLYQQELEDHGYRVASAASGQEALDRLEEVDPDLILLDIAMPGMDGIETLGKILGRREGTPVILNTAYTSYKDNFMTWSADAYVVKSSDMSQLESTIERLLEERQEEKRKRTKSHAQA